MLAIALGVYLMVFAVVVAVFCAASKQNPQPFSTSSSLDWEDWDGRNSELVGAEEKEPQDLV